MSATDEYETPRWATLGLAIGFVLLAAFGVITVLIPELEDEPIEPATQSVERETHPEDDGTTR
jgi:predicted outer membrane lipoprotein